MPLGPLLQGVLEQTQNILWQFFFNRFLSLCFLHRVCCPLLPPPPFPALPFLSALHLPETFHFRVTIRRAYRIRGPLADPRSGCVPFLSMVAPRALHSPCGASYPHAQAGRPAKPAEATTGGRRRGNENTIRRKIKTPDSGTI